MDDQEQAVEFKPCAPSVFVVGVVAVAVALGTTVLVGRLLGSDTWFKVLALVVLGLLPLGRALGLRNSYVVKVAPTWISGPGRRSDTLEVQREDVVALRRRDDARILEVAGAESIVIKLRYYGNDAWRLESAIHQFASGTGSWIVRRTA